jgi:type I restriction-modification system DNA methylase subunit
LPRPTSQSPKLEPREKVGVMNQISINQAAQIIGVSSATIRNWVKAGYVSPVNARPLAFSEDSLISLKNQISDGSIPKLHIRANKAQSKQHFVPLESAVNTDVLENLQLIVQKFKESKLEIEPLLFLVTIRQLEQNFEAKRNTQTDVFDLTPAVFTRVSVQKEMHNWQASLGTIQHKDLYLSVYDLLPEQNTDDFLGILYQSLRSEGNKSNLGSYYTPTHLVHEALNDVKLENISNFLDPCCGTGKYLIGAAQIFSLQPESIYGFDIDRIAVQIARINLLLQFKTSEFTPRIFCLDTLSELANEEFFCETNHLIGFFDVIATNPPWGAYKNSSIPKQFEGILQSGETYSMFILKSLQLLKQNGELSFVLPESILKIKTHADIRAYILKNSSITKIIQLGRQFSGVFTPVIRLDLKKVISKDHWLDLIDDKNLATRVNQNRFLKNSDFIFDTQVDTDQQALIAKIYATPYFTLHGHSEWALGIVTGNNSKFLRLEQLPNLEPIFRGSDIHPFYLMAAKTFIEFTPNEFQQVAPERFFRAKEKLVYKFISKKLVFAFDNTQAITLNSANILIPKIPTMSIKVVMAFLNSSVFQFLFTKKFATHKVLRGDLEKMPFPILTPEIHDQIESKVNQILEKEMDNSEINALIYEIFCLTEEEIGLIKQTTGEASWKS